MRPDGTGSPPPFWVWGASFLLAALVLGFTAFDLLGHPPPRPVYGPDYFHLERLDRWRKAHAGTKKVLVLGTSLSAWGLLPAGPMRELAREEGLPPVSVVAVTRPGDGIEPFLPLLDRLSAAGPDIVIIEAGLLLRRQRPLTVREELLEGLRLRLAVRPFLNRVSQRLGLSRPAAGSAVVEDTQNLEGPNDSYFEGALHDSHRLTLWEERWERSELTPFPPDRDLDALLRGLSSGRRRLLIVDPGRSARAMSVWPPRLTEGSRKLAGHYCERYGIEYLEFPPTLGLDCFHDFVHLNAKGRRLFSRWLLHRLAETPQRRGRA